MSDYPPKIWTYNYFHILQNDIGQYMFVGNCLTEDLIQNFIPCSEIFFYSLENISNVKYILNKEAHLKSRRTTENEKLIGEQN